MGVTRALADVAFPHPALRADLPRKRERLDATTFAESASPADAWNPVAEQPVPLPDGRSGRRATGYGCRKSRSSDLYRTLHRQRAVSDRWGDGRWHHRSYCRRRYRGHPGCVADAAGIVDRAVEPARIRRPRRNAADAGILGRRSCGSGQERKDRNAHQCRSAGHPYQREDRNWLRAPHESVIRCPPVPVHGNNWDAPAQVPGASSREADARRPHTLHRIALLWSNRAGVWRRTSST